MRTVCTDILMICKGWGTAAFESREEALKNYIGLFTGRESEYIDDNTVLHFLSRSVKKFISSERLIEALNNNAESYLYRDMPVIPFLIKLYINLLIDRVVTDLDLKDYQFITKYSKENNSILVTPWWKMFKDDKVEDDRKW